MIPGAVIILIVVAYFIRWVLSLHPRTRNLFFIAGATYVLGGLGLETIGAFIADSTFLNPEYIFVSTSEEVLEMLGVLIMLYAVLLELEGKPIDLQVSR